MSTENKIKCPKHETGGGPCYCDNVSASGSNELLCENKTQRIQIDNLERLLAFEKREKMMIRVSMLSSMTLGEWKELKQQEPGLFNFIKGAVNGADT